MNGGTRIKLNGGTILNRLTIKGFWSNYCKRPIHSTYNSVSRKHLQRYFDEVCFRYTHRMVSLEQRFVSVIRLFMVLPILNVSSTHSNKPGLNTWHKGLKKYF